MDTWEKLQAVEQNFQAMEQLLLSTARTLPEPIFILDEHGTFLDVIGGRKRSIFHSGKLIVGKRLHDILPDNLADMLMQTISEVIRDDSLKTLEYQLGPGDIAGASPENPRGRLWFEGRVCPIRDRSGELHSAVWLATDITEKKNQEKKIRELSDKDILTGAYNRRYFMQIFDQEYSIARRYKSKLSVMLIDIDHLKNINETFGNDGGDAVLKRFVIFCEDNLRQSDLSARYSGGEFIIMLPETPKLGAAIIAERIRASVEETPVTFGEKSIQNTISIGISMILDTDTNSSALLSRADAALYQAKRKGRNRIEIL